MRLGVLVMVNRNKEVVDLIEKLAIASFDCTEDLAAGEVLDLVQQAGRSEVVKRLVEQVRPYAFNPDRWISWAAGGSFPNELNMTRPVPSSQRASRAIGSASRDAARAQAKVDAAKLALSEAEAERDAAQAVNAAQMHFAIMHQIVDATRGTFAMGPAWTVMRALAAYYPQDTASFAAMTPQQREECKAADEVTARRTSKMLATLDFWCGDQHFEHCLRSTIMEMTELFAMHDEKREQSGVKRRPLKTARDSMRPTPLSEVSAVIDKLRLEPKVPSVVLPVNDFNDVPF